MKSPVRHLTDFETHITHEKSTRRKRLIPHTEIHRGDITTMNYAWMTKGNEMDVHSHADGEEIYLFLGGRGKIRIADLWHPVRRGDFVIIPPDTRHSIKNTRSARLTFITIRTKQSSY